MSWGNGALSGISAAKSFVAGEKRRDAAEQGEFRGVLGQMKDSLRGSARVVLFPVSRFGRAVRRWAGKRKDLGSISLRLSFLFRKVVVCGRRLVTLSITSY